VSRSETWCHNTLRHSAALSHVYQRVLGNRIFWIVPMILECIDSIYKYSAIAASFTIDKSIFLLSLCSHLYGCNGCIDNNSRDGNSHYYADALMLDRGEVAVTWKTMKKHQTRAATLQISNSAQKYWRELAI